VIEDCTVIILAGGSSQRMGSDKANLLLDGQSLLQRVTVTMKKLFPKVLLSVRKPRPEIDLPQIRDDPSCAGPLAGLASGLAVADTAWVFAVGCDMPFIKPEVVELLGGYRFKAHLLLNQLPEPSAFLPPSRGKGRKGVEAGNDSASTPSLFLPLQGGGDSLSNGLSGLMCQAVVPVVQGYPQPLAAFYARSCLDAIRTHLDSGGKNSLQAILKKLEVCYVEESQIQSADPCLRSFLDLDTPQDLAAALRGVN